MGLYMHNVIVSKETIKSAEEGRGQTFILTPILLPPDKFIVHVRRQFLELLQTTTTTSHVNPHPVIVVSCKIHTSNQIRNKIPTKLVEMGPCDEMGIGIGGSWNPVIVIAIAFLLLPFSLTTRYESNVNSAVNHGPFLA
jgi:hypothetical protein